MHPLVCPRRQKCGVFFNENIFQGVDGVDDGVQIYYNCRTVYRPTRSNIICVRCCVHKQNKKKSVGFSVEKVQLLRGH